MKKILELKSEQIALMITGIFLLVGIFVWKHFGLDWRKDLPLALFYITIDINTYFSIALFKRIVPNYLIEQHIFDGLLIALYIALAFSMGNSLLFSFITLILFIIAAMKYTRLHGEIDHPKLLKNKIFIDLLGVLMSAITVGGIIFGYETFSIWFLATTFIIANIYLLFIEPMYMADK